MNKKLKKDISIGLIIAVMFVIIISFSLSGILSLISSLSASEGFRSLGVYYDKFIVYLFIFIGLFGIGSLIAYSSKRDPKKNFIKILFILFFIGISLVLLGDIFGIEESRFGCIIETKTSQETGCYTDLAIKNNDPSLCDEINNEFYRPLCYSTFVSKPEDSYLCEKISKTNSWFAKCYSNIAQKTGDIYWCEKLKEVAYYSGDKKDPRNMQFYLRCRDLFDS